ncbi:MAG: FAD-binding oxidoreductase [Thermodesulfobacteriota bacterium]|jgi:alkyldihydroxyacetonephosphate synthase
MDTLISDLREIFGSDHVLTTPEARAAFSRDALRPHRGFAELTAIERQPIAVVRPRSTEDVVRLVRLARQRRIPLVPYGGGSGLMGGALSVRPGIVADMTSMSHILRVDTQALTVQVQSGVRLRPLGEHLARYGLLLGHDPWSISVATVGGAIGTHGLGYLGGRYGAIGSQVLGLEVVLGTGEVIRTPPLRKRSTGPDLTRLFIGAEGTLGIVTEATLQVFPQPQRWALLGFTFPDFPTALDAVITMQRRGVQPTSLDLAVENWPAELRERRGFPPPEPPVLRLVFAGLEQEVEAQCQEARGVARPHGATALPLPELEEYWGSRHAIADRWARDPDLREGRWLETPAGKSQLDFLHFTVPVSRLLAFREQALARVRSHGVSVCEEGIWIWPECYSLVLYYQQRPGKNAAQVMRDTTEALYRLAHEVGGSVEYVHGVGVRLGHLMERELGGGMAVLRALKAALDPDGVLNPGKLGLS